jgi:hypothetical protein
MNRKMVLIGVIVIVILGVAIGYREIERRRPREVTFKQLEASPDEYSGRRIVVEGFYFHGWETIVLSERLELSSFADDHLIPKGLMMWVEGGIPLNIHDSLYRQKMMGPGERFGKIRIKGVYETGGEYGHTGNFDSQIKPTEAELLQWSP